MHQQLSSTFDQVCCKLWINKFVVHVELCRSSKPFLIVFFGSRTKNSIVNQQHYRQAIIAYVKAQMRVINHHNLALHWKVGVRVGVDQTWIDTLKMYHHGSWWKPPPSPPKWTGSWIRDAVNPPTPPTLLPTSLSGALLARLKNLWRALFPPLERHFRLPLRFVFEVLSAEACLDTDIY